MTERTLTAAQKIIEGLEEAIRFAHGEDTGARVHVHAPVRAPTATQSATGIPAMEQDPKGMVTVDDMLLAKRILTRLGESTEATDRRQRYVAEEICQARTAAAPQNHATALRALGWVCVEPATEKPPEPAVGQVWVSGRASTAPRTITRIAPCKWYPSGVPCIHFRTPSHIEGQFDGVLLPSTWRAWVRKSGARPQ